MWDNRRGYLRYSASGRLYTTATLRGTCTAAKHGPCLSRRCQGGQPDPLSAPLLVCCAVACAAAGMSQPNTFRHNFITPAVIGSLPAGLSQVERANLARLAASPAAARLQELPMVGGWGWTGMGASVRKVASQPHVECSTMNQAGYLRAHPRCYQALLKRAGGV